MLKISSRDNARLKQAKQARDGKIGNLIFVEGARLADEALRSNLSIETIFLSDVFAETERGKNFIEKFAAAHESLFTVSENIFNSLADTKSAQGIVLIARKPETGKAKIEAVLANEKNAPLVIVLHRTNNPSNLGAILRTAEATNVSGIVTTANSADVFSPKSLRGAMGAAFRLPIWTDASFTEVLDWARARNLISVAADVRARKSYLEIDWNVPRLLIFGSEAHGLSVEETTRLDETLTIPMANGVESLNLAVSAGVVLFEARRQNAG